MSKTGKNGFYEEFLNICSKVSTDEVKYNIQLFNKGKFLGTFHLLFHIMLVMNFLRKQEKLIYTRRFMKYNF